MSADEAEQRSGGPATKAPEKAEDDAGDDAGAEIFGVDKRKAIIGIAVAAALSVGVVAVIGQVTSYHEILDAFRHASGWWLLLALGGEWVAYGGYVVAYRSVARADGGPRLSYWTAARVVGLGLGAYVIGSAAGGLGVDYWAMHRAGAPRHEAARRTLALNTLQAAALTTFAALAGIAVLITGAPHRIATVFAVVWVCIVPAAVLASKLVSDEQRAPTLLHAPDDEELPSVREQEQSGRPARTDLRAWGYWLYVKARKGLADAVGGVVFVRHVVSHPLRYAGGVIGYPLFWLGDFFTLWSALHAFGVSLSPQYLVVAEATAWAVSFLPLPAGGAGAAEATMAFTLNAVGVPLTQAISAAFAYRAINFWLPVIPALALLTQVQKLQRELPNTEHARQDEDAAIHQSGV